ncbi:hypothetical protein A176_006406 [Myxococcus hansupus]|uniref:Uncharacterized protein n=1 Tax=Pseudomyxococcus hansupus TaxID=1297742 RepID=A0A0H4X2X3_9BACT|nr:hypothetical protein [Myxococcus hansupus]AKQ69494.1 hypothetical protein A176_006406 [Myxococcus hansupus]
MATDIIRERRFNFLIAGVLSFFIPGLGQLYKGQFIRAVLWFLMVGAGYWLLLIPGFVLHVFCVLGAAFGSAGKDHIRMPG